MTKQWTRQDKIACITIFVICIVTFVAFVSTMTLSYFFDTHSAEQLLTAGEVKLTITGGPSDNGEIQFPSVLAPNTQYSVAENSNLSFRITNASTSGDVYLMIELNSTESAYIQPTVSSDWAYGVGSTTRLFYLKPLQKNQTLDLCEYWQVGNYPNSVSGDTISYIITAKAVQVQGGALQALVDLGGAWANAPQIFYDMAGVVKNAS